jgi:hypothetical protein
MVPTPPDRRGEMVGKKPKYHAAAIYCRAFARSFAHACRSREELTWPRLKSPAGKELHTVDNPVSNEFSSRDDAR